VAVWLGRRDAAPGPPTPPCSAARLAVRPFWSAVKGRGRDMLALGLEGMCVSDVKSARDLHHCEGLMIWLDLLGGDVEVSCLGLGSSVGYGRSVLTNPICAARSLCLRPSCNLRFGATSIRGTAGSGLAGALCISFVFGRAGRGFIAAGCLDFGAAANFGTRGSGLARSTTCSTSFSIRIGTSTLERDTSLPLRVPSGGMAFLSGKRSSEGAGRLGGCAESP
jgi:hypothetical protein